MHGPDDAVDGGDVHDAVDDGDVHDAVDDGDALNDALIEIWCWLFCWILMITVKWQELQNVKLHWPS